MASVAKKVEKGTATYIDAEDYAYHTGKALSNALKQNIKEEILPNGHVPQNVAEKILLPTLRDNHSLVSGVTAQVQTSLNQKAGIGLKAQTIEFDAEMAEGLAHKLTNGAFKDTRWVLGAPIVTNSQAVVDRTLKKNVEFQAKVGLRPKIVREAEAHCCSWCADLAGTYEYGSEPKDIYRRHANCRCSVDFKPGDGKRQNVWSKEWHDDAEQEKIENRQKTEEVNRLFRHSRSIMGDMDPEVFAEAIRLWYSNNEFPGLTEAEKEFVYTELDNWLSKRITDPVVQKVIGDYEYTAICRGHNEYKIIHKKPIESSWLDSIMSEIFGDDWRKYET